MHEPLAKAAARVPRESFAVQLAKRLGAHAAARAHRRLAGWAITGRAIGVLAVKEGPTHFEPLATLCVTGDVTIHIHRTFALDEVPAALAHLGEGRALGKVVVGLS